MPLKPTQFDALAQHVPGLGRDPAAVRRRIETMERLLERMFVIPASTGRSAST